jgi:two-component sensor histidine kinase
VAIIVPTLVRMALGGFVEGLPFLTYFPAVLLAALWLGWQWGFAVAVGCALAANFLFMGPVGAFSMRSPDLSADVAFLVASGLMIAAANGLRRATVELDRSATREAELNAELQHRVKNNLAIVQALAYETFRTVKEPRDFYPALEGRLAALGQAHNVLVKGHWQVCTLPELVEETLRPFGPDRISMAGPACALPATSCVPLVLMLHELATNAVKYGALSNDAGRVDISWVLQPSGSMSLRWREAGGPPVEPPTRRGLGSRLLTRQGGIDAVTREFKPAGVICEVVVTGAQAV